ncbi:MAG: glycoside hydrolase family 31 protein [Cytophagaceae bacterium]|nr:glycoside hydrolase family 31 protein [Cytophagaceae bacterium]MDW8455514.1 glycoside hydrolase family 31 protein [Cytophagaceae bacterium]
MESYMNLGHEQVAAQLFPGELIDVKRENSLFYFVCANKLILQINVLSDKIIRFRYTTTGYFGRDFSYSGAQLYKGQIKYLDLLEEEEKYIIITSYLECSINKKNLKITIIDKDGVLISEDEKGFHWQEHLKYGGDIVMYTRKIQSGERFYGLGDKPCDLDLRAKRFELWGKDTYAFGKDTDPIYKNIPFFFGLHHKIAYGIFFDNSFRSFFDFGMERPNVASFWAQGGEMNFYFIYGPSLIEVAEQYTLLTGKPELPPLWALGYHQCKWSYYPESKVREICQTFRQKKIPLDCIYLDIDYMDGFRCFTWNKEYFPDPQKMISDLMSMGIKTIVIIDPGIKIDENYWVYREGVENSYFCKRMDGPLMHGKVWPGECHFPDFTNPKVREWWANLFEDLIKKGVSGVWNDMNEPAVFEIETMPYDVRHDYDGDSCSHRKAHNIYGMQMARATYEGIKKFMAPRRPFVITRSGFAGVQRYSSVWTGDNVASWEHLQIANRQCQRLSISGISFCGSDIGGFILSPSGELYARWIQLGVFHMFCRTHSSGDHGDQEPWSFGEEIEAIAKKYIEFRYQLLPYLYTTFWQYVTYGTPALRPLVFLDQYDTETHGRQEEFGVGDNLLVCPVTSEGQEGRWVYLPEGQWYYFWDDTYYDGNSEVWAEAPLDIIPIYVKAGAVLPMYPIMQYVGEKAVEVLYLHVYFCKTHYESELYEDAGDGYQYLDGEYNIKAFKTTLDKNTFRLSQHIEGKFKTSYLQYKIYLHGMPSTPMNCKVDDEKITLTKENCCYTFTIHSSFKLFECTI